MSEVKGQGHILYLVCKQYFSFSFHINQTSVTQHHDVIFQKYFVIKHIKRFGEIHEKW